ARHRPLLAENLRDRRGLPSLLFPPCLRDKPGLPVRSRGARAIDVAEERPLVGRQPSRPPPSFRYGTRRSFAAADGFCLQPPRLDLLARPGDDERQSDRGFREISRADVAPSLRAAPGFR